jgi:hypothetical protein
MDYRLVVQYWLQRTIAAKLSKDKPQELHQSDSTPTLLPAQSKRQPEPTAMIDREATSDAIRLRSCLEPINLILDVPGWLRVSIRSCEG